MIDSLQRLAKTEELAFSKKQFRGKNAGKIYRYSNHVDGLIKARTVMFVMTILVFYPILITYIFSSIFVMEVFIERAVFSIMFLVAGLIFNKFRIVSIILATIPLILILSIYLMPGQFNMYRIAFAIAMLVIVKGGFYHNYMTKKIAKELDLISLENHLIDEGD